jgi:hypothetical protein
MFVQARRSGHGVQALAFRPTFYVSLYRIKKKKKILSLSRTPVSQTLKYESVLTYEAVLSYNSSNFSYYYILLKCKKNFSKTRNPQIVTCMECQEHFHWACLFPGSLSAHDYVLMKKKTSYQFKMWLVCHFNGGRSASTYPKKSSQS